ncbi:hypothetical protein H4Q32_024298 [Labeo rohita]|uniref:Uncharacterized protein n=1 Tax=Labeo rohita TaxID=84645 RepID=A0ABQ8LYI1_LABRO|nr:hypothetical protein H4Q32_024298 [Labeo rohita]
MRNVFLEEKHTSTEKLVELTQDHLSNYSRHIYNIKHQSERLGKLRESLTQNEVVVHVDYKACHGKGAPDGVGHALKNLADTIVSYGTSIPDADTHAEQLNLNSSVRLFKITEEDVKSSAELVPPDLKTVPGTMRIHQLTSTKAGLIYTREVSCFCDFACGCLSLKRRP